MPISGSALFVCGAECGLVAVGTAGPAGTTRHWSTVTGSPTVVTSGPTPMRSTRAFRFNASASAPFLRYAFDTAIGSGGTAVGRGYVYFATLPNAATGLLVFRGGSGGTSRGAYYDSATQTIQAGGSTATLGGGGVSVTTGVWYRIDVKAVFAATHTVDVQVNGVSVTQQSAAIAAETCTEIGIGSTSTVTGDWYIDDVVATSTSGDYPILDGTVAGLYPTSDATHNYNSAADFNDVGGNLNATSSLEVDTWQSLANPLSTTINGTTFITNLAGASTEYLAWNFADLPSNVQLVNAVAVISTNHSSAATANNTALEMHFANTQGGYKKGDPGGTVYDLSETTIVVCYIVPDSGNGAGLWTASEVNGAFARWGLSTDVNPDPILDGLCLEVDWTPQNPPRVIVQPTVAVHRSQSW